MGSTSAAIIPVGQQPVGQNPYPQATHSPQHEGRRELPITLPNGDMYESPRSDVSRRAPVAQESSNAGRTEVASERQSSVAESAPRADRAKPIKRAVRFVLKDVPAAIGTGIGYSITAAIAMFTRIAGQPVTNAEAANANVFAGLGLVGSVGAFIVCAALSPAWPALVVAVATPLTTAVFHRIGLSVQRALDWADQPGGSTAIQKGKAATTFLLGTVPSFIGQRVLVPAAKMMGAAISGTARFFSNGYSAALRWSQS